MIRHGLIAACFALAYNGQADAQAWRFNFEKGQTLTSKVDHVTAVVETVDGKATNITSKLSVVKQWRVLDVDSQGVATLEQSLVSLRSEQTRPDGDVLVFDSSNVEKSSKELQGMAKFINVPVATIRVDGLGRAVEVKAGPKGKYDAEPPFAMVLPGQPVREGQAWLRPYAIALEAPIGNGEKYQAEQLAKFVKLEGTKATIELTTTIKDMPEAASAKAPLIQKQLAGQLVFDVVKGQVESVRLSVDQTVQNHKGAGSSYRFASNYLEQNVTSAIVPTGGTR